MELLDRMRSLAASRRHADWLDQAMADARHCSMSALARTMGNVAGSAVHDYIDDMIAMLTSANDGVFNLSLAYSVGSSALTIAAKQQGGSNADADNPIVANVRSSTASSADFTVCKITAAASLVISSGSTLGHRNADGRWVYVYLINPTSTTLELAVSSKFQGRQGIFSTTAEGGAGAADSDTAIYSTTARASVPFILVGRFKAPQTVAGTWAAVPSSAEMVPFEVDPDSQYNTDGYLIPTTGGFAKNAIINGDMAIAQRALSFTSTGSANNDDTYNLDRWTLLSDGNDIVDVTREATTVPSNGIYAIALDVETVNKKFGILQIIEQKNSKGLIGRTATLSFKAKVSATTKLDNLKAAILAWDGTADTVTSDVVSAWGVEGTNPTLVSNWTYENTPANLSPTTSYATYTVTAAIDTASTKNIAVFIWSDVTDTTLGDFLYITDVQLEVGAVATEFERRPIQQELELCQRYYQKSWEIDVAVSTATSPGFWFRGSTVALATGTTVTVVNFPVVMRASPTVATSPYTTPGNNSRLSNASGTDLAASTGVPVGACNRSFNIENQSGGDITPAGGGFIFHWSATAEL